MQQCPKVSVIIVNWNGRRYLKDCLNSVFGQTYPNYEVIFVDNGSTDSSVEYVRSNFPKAKVIINERNLGFARGNNIGIEEAFRVEEVKYVVTLNNDTIVEREWLAPLIDTMQADESIGSCQSKILSFQHRDVINNIGIAICKDGSACNRGINETDTSYATEEIFGVCAAAALYRRETLEEVGLFDEIFFAYMEDVDLAWRLRLRGWRAVMVPSSRIYHVHSASALSSKFKLFLIHRNSIFVLIKNLPLRYILLFPLHFLTTRLRFLKTKQNRIRALRGDISLFRAALIIVWSWIASLRYLLALIKRRHFIQKRKSTPSTEILSWFRRFAP